MHIIKSVIVLVKMHLPITANSVRWATKADSSLYPLHNLGDKNLLVWKRETTAIGLPFEWIPSPYLADLMAFIWVK